MVIICSDASRILLLYLPELEVFRSVVSSIAIPVMHTFMLLEGPSLNLGHDEAVLSEPPALRLKVNVALGSDFSTDTTGTV